MGAEPFNQLPEQILNQTNIKQKLVKLENENF